MSQREAVIVDAVRTPIGRHRGALARIRPDDMAAATIRALLARAEVPPAQIDDVILGCTNQSGEDSRNVARMAALLAGCPVGVPGQTVNRLCGSGLQAIISATHAIRSDEGDVIVAGGVESMTRSPWVVQRSEEPFPRGVPVMADSTIGWRFTNPAMPKAWTISMGETAEEVAKRYGITREAQDEFALESQRRYANAESRGAFVNERIPLTVEGKDGVGTVVALDEHPRPNATLDGLSKLAPAFKDGGTVSAGNSSGINDGAAALLITEQSVAQQNGWKPLARVVSTAVSGVAPDIMGMGPVPAVRLALKRANLTIGDLSLIELNEAFAAQALACMNELRLPADRVNVNGGAIALGHPLGASGARIMTTLVHELARRGERYGIATMCIGVGQGIAAVVENLT